MEFIKFFGIIFGLIFIRLLIQEIMGGAAKTCVDCGHHGRTKYYRPGSFTVELLLWLFFGFGIFYTFYRMGGKKEVCANCTSDKLSKRPVKAINTKVVKTKSIEESA